MFETIVSMKPKEHWRPGVTVDSLIVEMDKALQFPGVSNAWTMPIKARIDMLSTGPYANLREGDGHGPGRDGQARQADRARHKGRARYLVRLRRAGHWGYYLEITPDREALARYGILMQDVQDTIAAAPGGQTVTTTVEGRHRFSVNMRYPRDLRDNPKAIANDILLPMSAGGAVPLSEVAKVEPARGPTSIRTENGQFATYIYVDIRDRDIGGYTADPQRAVIDSVQFPAGYDVVWSGQFEYMQRAAARLKIVIPVTLTIIYLLVYLNFRSITETVIVMLSLPFALVGGLWMM